MKKSDAVFFLCALLFVLTPRLTLAENYDNQGRLEPTSEPEAAQCRLIQDTLSKESEVMLFREDANDMADPQNGRTSILWQVQACRSCTPKVKESLVFHSAQPGAMAGYIEPDKNFPDRGISSWEPKEFSDYVAYLNQKGCDAQSAPTDSHGYMVDYSGGNKECVRQATTLYFLGKFGLGSAAREELSNYASAPFIDFFQVCHRLASESSLLKDFNEVRYKLRHFGEPAIGSEQDSRQASQPQAKFFSKGSAGGSSSPASGAHPAQAGSVR